MNKNRKGSSAGGIGLLSLLTLIFIALKLCKVIGWSWVWVLSPLWITAAIALLIFIAALVGATSVVVDQQKRKNRRR